MHDHYSVCPTWDADLAKCQCDKDSLLRLINLSVLDIKNALNHRQPAKARLAQRRLVFNIRVFESIHQMPFSQYRRELRSGLANKDANSAKKCA